MNDVRIKFAWGRCISTQYNLATMKYYTKFLIEMRYQVTCWTNMNELHFFGWSETNKMILQIWIHGYHIQNTFPWPNWWTCSHVCSILCQKCCRYIFVRKEVFAFKFNSSIWLNSMLFIIFYTFNENIFSNGIQLLYEMEVIFCLFENFKNAILK